MTEAKESPLRPALMRGWHRRCPNCGAGPMLSGYLDVREHCPVCTEQFAPPHKPARHTFLTLSIVTVLLVPLIIYLVLAFDFGLLVLIAIFSVGGVGLALYLLPRIKGLMVALKWARRKQGQAAKR
ncbi:uncharacterized protein (DUF983 family) [Rhodovulum imhoffii]|uniref:Uncharacterized protein (DUF983 family) n=1 Tax=Rhodovulum imhoffii TaxID=365340 RepID=A0A2T5BQZ2_9RHOB|nr:DUF983 domain-containing protein [Rhodovulum imhoffii]MBK5932578.1 hypothetical protein [Rhodovulum imhoffii]PTN01639.1 uncharacterized protein (DUF983 family) [Rhodovulum imhoffii]